VHLELAVNARLADPFKAGTMEGWRSAVGAALAAPACADWLIGLAAGFAGTIAALTGLDTCECQPQWHLQQREDPRPEACCVGLGLASNRRRPAPEDAHHR
jgi:hypothetical protein